ncbi:MAG TPA: BON domain-containing protein [Pyrinomonadaceae bacterium]|nr:BON domain-containing protein [Pyrinomonadaceae bacterium]
MIETPAARNRRGAHPNARQPGPGAREGIVALTVIGAAALATFIALFLTSRPYDPMNSTLAPVQTVPAGSLTMQPSPKPSPTISPSPQNNQVGGVVPSPEPTGETVTTPDDAGIQSQIERTLAADPILSKLDVSTLVEGGKVTIVGSVKSADLKQRVEKTLRSVKGVISVDNQLVVTEATP